MESIQRAQDMIELKAFVHTEMGLWILQEAENLGQQLLYIVQSFKQSLHRSSVTRGSRNMRSRAVV